MIRGIGLGGGGGGGGGEKLAIQILKNFLCHLQGWGVAVYK